MRHDNMSVLRNKQIYMSNGRELIGLSNYGNQSGILINHHTIVSVFVFKTEGVRSQAASHAGLSLQKIYVKFISISKRASFFSK